MAHDVSESPRGSSFADYQLVVAGDDSYTGGSCSASKRNNESGILVRSQLTTSFREEVGVHNDESSRILFDEDTTTLPSRSEDQFMNNQEPLLYLPQREPISLTAVNYLNAVTYAANLFVSWGIGVWGLNGILETRWAITTEYETLVTPAKWAYFLWAPILILEGIFAVAQLTPFYRNRPIIQAGTGFFFFYCFILQTAWTFFFSFQLFVLSFISVVLALLSLLGLLLSQIHTISTGDERRSWHEYILFRFPFYLHTGWMVLMTTDHFALLFRAFGTSAHVQASIDILSLALLLASGVACLIRPPYNDFVIPAVILWCFLGIASRLENPSERLLEIYGNTLVLAIRDSSLILAGVLGLCLAPCVVVWLAREFCTIRVVELDLE